MLKQVPFKFQICQILVQTTFFSKLAFFIYYLRMKKCQGNARLKEEVGTWNKELKQYFVTQLALSKPYDNKLVAEKVSSKKIGNFLVKIKEESLDTGIPMWVMSRQIDSPQALFHIWDRSQRPWVNSRNITGWNRKDINGAFIRIRIDVWRELFCQ